MQLERLTHRPSDAEDLIARAIDLGVDHIDTAQFYGNGFANEVIRSVLVNERRIVVATKVGADPEPGAKPPVRPAQRPEQIRSSVEENLRSLGLEQLPVVNLRRLDIAPGLVAEGDQIVDIDDQLAAMIAMRGEGKIGAIGLSAVDPENLRRALPAGIVCVQTAYSLLSRQYEGMLDLCVRHGIAWVPFFPLGSAGFPGWPRVIDHPKVVEIASEMAVTPSQLGLAWLLEHRPNILLIPGTTSVPHLQENIASASLSLGGNVLSALDILGATTIEPISGDAR
jgi:aryl-alcohol dehydrogenase-like predicted oxidoreductase